MRQGEQPVPLKILADELYELYYKLRMYGGKSLSAVSEYGKMSVSFNGWNRRSRLFWPVLGPGWGYTGYRSEKVIIISVIWELLRGTIINRAYGIL